MNRMMDLVVRIGLDQCSFSLGVREDWLVRRKRVFRSGGGPKTVTSMGEGALYQELTAFLRKGRMLFDGIGKVVLVTDIADRFLDSLSREPKRIGYLRIAPDFYEPEHITQLLEKHGGILLTEYIKPGDSFGRERCEGVLQRFSSAGVTDIGVNSVYQVESRDEESRIIQFCERMAPGRFNYHSLEPGEYQSFLLTENRLLVNVCIRGSLERELEEIKRACGDIDVHAPLVVLDGSGYCIDWEAALADPLCTWQGGHAAAMMGAALEFGFSEAVTISPSSTVEETDRRGESVIIDRIKGMRPVPAGRTRRFFGFQVSGPFPGAMQFLEIPHRNKLLEAIRSINTTTGPLPVFDMTGGLVDLQDLEYPVHRVSDFDAVLLTGAQSAEFRKYFHCMISPMEKKSNIREILRKEADRWFYASGVKLTEVVEEFSISETRYLKMERERMTLQVSGCLSKLP